AELPSPVSGTVAEILAQPDEVVATGAVVCRIAVEERAPAKRAKPAAVPEPAGNGDGNATPVAVRMANAHGIDLSKLHGSGPRGRVTKEDVEEAIGGNGATAQATSHK